MVILKNLLQKELLKVSYFFRLLLGVEVGYAYLLLGMKEYSLLAV